MARDETGPRLAEGSSVSCLTVSQGLLLMNCVPDLVESSRTPSGEEDRVLV